MNLHDMLIVDALIADGTGKPAFPGALTVRDGVISGIVPQGGELPEYREKYDAGQKLLCPGFIDAHGHSDISILADPEAFSKVSQGITSEITGNCGLSPFPVTNMNREHLQDLYKCYNVDISWRSFREYRAELDRRKPALNIFPLCGHNTLRAAFNGYVKKELAPDAMSLMRSSLDECLETGAAGFSSGLLYCPGVFSSENEILSLLEVLAKFSKPYTLHLRSEGDRLLESIDEAVRNSREACCPRLHISHLKAAGKDNFHKIDDALARLGQNASGSLNVSADRYPYLESMTSLSVYLPSPWDEWDRSRLARELEKPDFRTLLTAELDAEDEEFWRRLRILQAELPETEDLSGKSIADIGRRISASPAEACVRILHADPGAAVASKGMSPENLRKIILHPLVCACTDEVARPSLPHIGTGHPRAFGSMPEFIRLGMKYGLEVEQCVRKCTSLPARVFGIRNRGLLRKGYAADLVLVDKDRLSGSADFSRPCKTSEGVIATWVNGQKRF